MVLVQWQNCVEWMDTSRTGGWQYSQRTTMGSVADWGRAGMVQDMSTTEQARKKPAFDHFDNMDEVVNCYGLTVLFWVCAPWTTLAMLGAQIIECSGDASMLMSGSRRTFPTRGKSNEPWDAAFDLLSHLAVGTNLAVVIFGMRSGAEFLSFKGKVLTFFACEHLYFLAVWLLRQQAPAMPIEVEHLAMKQELLVKKYLDCQEGDAGSIQSVARGTAPMTVVQERDDEEDEMMDGVGAGCAVQ